MVVRTNGAPRQGVWFSADVRFLDFTVTNGDFVNDLTVTTTDPRQADVVNSTLEVVLEAIASRGTVIALTVVDATNASVIVDYAQAYDPANEGLGNAVVVDVEAEIIALVALQDGSGDSPADLTMTDLTIESGFGAVALATPS